MDETKSHIMKRITSVLLVIFYTATLRGQDTLTKEYYLQKSNNQKKAAWVLLGAGAVAAIGGAVWFSETFSIDIFGPDRDPGENTAGFVMLAGLGSMAGSIPLFIASARNKGRAEKMTVFIGTERLPAFSARNWGVRYPVAGLRIGL